MDFPLVVKSQVKLWVGISIIIIGFYFIYQGSDVLEKASTFENQILIEELPDPEPIYHRDPADQVTWINEFVIYQTDKDLNIVGNDLVFRAYVEMIEEPEQIAFNIFHEDSDVYFTSSEDYHYKKISENLDRVPSLKYGDIYYIKFNPSETSKGQESYTLNGLSKIQFNKPGTYYAQVSVKLQNGTILHYHSNSSIFTIEDGKHEWMIEALGVLIDAEEINKPLIISSYGWSFIAIGIGLVISGISLLVIAIEKRLSVVEKINKKHYGNF